MTDSVKSRRRLMAGLGAAAAAATVGSGAGRAQGPASPFQPTRHPQDEWMDKLPGKHRVILDITTPGAVPDGLRYVGNLFNGSKSGYGLEDRDLALIVVLRHGATAYGYGEAIWSKYGKQLDSKATEPPTTNPYDAPPRNQISGLAARGVHYVVCGSASLGIARRLAGEKGDADAMLKTMMASMIPNSHMIAGVAGVVPVTHAQEYGYSYLFVG